MKVVATNKLRKALSQFPEANLSLQGWYRVMTQSQFKSEQELRETFGDMRGFDYEFKFPIPDSALLVHALINFESQIAYIDQIKPGNR